MKMRTTQLIRFGAMALAVAALLAVVSCEKKSGSIDPTTKTILTASMEQQVGDTKTSLDGVQIKWSAGDEISVFAGDNTTNNKFTINTGAGTTSATFTAETNIGSGAIYAFYPYSSGIRIEESGGVKYIYYNIPAVQTYTEGGISTNTNPSVAYSSSSATPLTFKNLSGIIRLQLKGNATIKKITVMSKRNSGRGSLSGSFRVPLDYGNGDPIPDSYYWNSDRVVLDLGVGVDLESGSDKIFNIVVPPYAVEADYPLTVLIETADGYMVKTTKKGESSIIRSKIVTMPSVTYVQTPFPTATYNGMNAIPAYLNSFEYTSEVQPGFRLFAPVNCGYEAASGSNKGYVYGKLYQFGRKYGQGYDDNDASVPEIKTDLITYPEANSLNNSFVNVSNHYTRWDNTYYTDSNGILQSANINYFWDEKSAFFTNQSPCPSGWRLMMGEEINGLYNMYGEGGKGTHGTTTNLDGIIFTGSSLFFPHAGGRSYDGTVIGDRGNNGYYWGNIAKGDFQHEALHLQINNGSPWVHTYGVGQAYSVRCVRM